MDGWLDGWMDGWNGVVKRMTTGGRKGREGFWWKAKGGSGEELDRGQNAAWIRSSRVLREEGGGDVDYREKGAEVFSLFSNIYIYIWSVANVAASGIRVPRECKADFLRASRVSS